MDQWASLRSELNREAEAIFLSSGEIVLIESSDESDSELILSGRAATLKLRHEPERNAVRWETDAEYGFERISEPIARLALALVKRLKLNPNPQRGR
jgi:hypothetical protein